MNKKLKIKVPDKLLENWERLSSSILDWRDKINGNLLFKFVWQPEDGEFLMGYPPENHKSLVLNYGNHNFYGYIRGIYFREKKVVYLRMHEREDWLKKTATLLRENGVGKDIRIIWGKEAREELEEDLRGL